MRIFSPIIVALTAAALFSAPASAQFQGGVYVSAGDVSGSAAPLTLRAPGAGADFEVSKVTFGARRSLKPPTSSGPGVAQITLKRGQTATIGQWFERQSRQSAGQGGTDLLIMNNGDSAKGPDKYLTITFTDLIISSYNDNGSAGATATIKYAKIKVIYTEQADDHSAN